MRRRCACCKERRSAGKTSDGDRAHCAFRQLPLTLPEVLKSRALNRESECPAGHCTYSVQRHFRRPKVVLGRREQSARQAQYLHKSLTGRHSSFRSHKTFRLLFRKIGCTYRGLVILPMHSVHRQRLLPSTKLLWQDRTVLPVPHSPDILPVLLSTWHLSRALPILFAWWIRFLNAIGQ